MPVSVIIPAYNAAATITKTLESLQEQTVQDWEAIVVDDGSTDGTPTLIHRFADSDARVRIVSRRNGGEGAARNSGLDEARHGWVLFLDADDWIAPRHIEKLTRALEVDQSLDAVHCGYARVAIDGSEVVEPYEPPTGD